MIIIGVDTGGTYTDAVALDRTTGKLIAKGKSPTTKEDLSIGISLALKTLPPETLEQASMVCLSTTLATNACVENKGGRAKLLLIGTTREILNRIEAPSKYGLSYDSVLCLETESKYDGTVVDIPNWDEVFEQNLAWFKDAEALAVTEIYAINSGAVSEKSAREAFEQKLNVPIVLANELSSGVNMMTRGATSLLNARLLTVVEELMIAVRKSLDELGCTAQMMLVRSDCSLMTRSLAEKAPVETILSGPAASTLGGMQLSKDPSCVIVDIGGTTTDISIVKEGTPKLAQEGIKIGGWATQTKGVHVETFGIGGDSALRIEGSRLTLSERRVIPICSAATRWPEIKKDLHRLVNKHVIAIRNFHEFLCLVKEPANLDNYTAKECQLIDILRDGPRMIDSFEDRHGIDKYYLHSSRLESEGIIIRAGLTLTDMMHVLGDFDAYDSEASTLLSEFFVANLENLEDRTPEGLAHYAYDCIAEKLYTSILLVLLQDSYPIAFAKGLDEQIRLLIKQAWEEKDFQKLVHLKLTVPTTIVGIGAPTHLFIPRVAEALGATCLIPNHAEVANAIGAALAEIIVTTKIRIIHNITSDTLSGFLVYSDDGGHVFDFLTDAQEFAIEAAKVKVAQEARSRGAIGELVIESGIASKDVAVRGGGTFAMDMHAWATVKSADFEMGTII